MVENRCGGTVQMLGAVLAVVAVLVLAACSPASADYRAEADKLEKEISAMPGVQRFELSVASDFFLGDNYFRLTAAMPEATEPQIGQVIARIDESLGKFGGLRDRSFEFVVGDRARVGSPKTLAAGPFLDAVRHARHYSASMPEGTISWELRPTPRISLGAQRTGTAEPLAAIRAMIGPTTTAEVSIDAAEHGRWNVDLPLSVERETELRRQLPENPWATEFVVIKDGAIVQLAVRNTTPSAVDPDLAYTQLSDTVRTLGPTTTHPLLLNWSWFFAYTEGKRNEGSVHAAGCHYTIPTADETLSAPARAVQHRMRQEFDTCR
ncbi:hypothetical protein [Nocardia vulneris]|uniref:Uncharacterized protein n=2 Tax=Nocardia vulneris TaxID=1141657 RepID=A0ABR4ZG08_9NOCA|nr:hypothetical protein [Nocardia vulneris]KIA64338.1 hypothetical protein FG87_13870 [Nocardia vulneris]